MFEKKSANIYSRSTDYGVAISYAILQVSYDNSDELEITYNSKGNRLCNALYLLRKCENKDIINALLQDLTTHWKPITYPYLAGISCRQAIIEALLRQGAWCEVGPEVSEILKGLQDTLLQAYGPTLCRNKHHQLQDSADALYQEVLVAIQEAGGKFKFYRQNLIFAPSFEIDEVRLNYIISKLERRNDSMALFICGLLLERRIANQVLKRYLDNLESEAYQAYMEKRTHDAIFYYLKIGSQEPGFVENLLQHLKITGVPSVQERLKRCDIDGTRQVFSVLGFFSTTRRDVVSVAIPIHKENCTNP